VFGVVCGATLVVFACLSGALAAGMAATQAYPLWQGHDYPRELSGFARANSSRRSIWVLDAWHAHPVTTLAGRQSVVGYGGWTSSHGLSETSRRRMIQHLMSDPEDTKDADAFGVSFVCVKKNDEKGLKFAVEANSTHWDLVFDNKRYLVYRRAA